MSTYEITNEQIESLSQDAATAGDAAQVELCRRALRGDEQARAECARVIAYAAAEAQS